MTDRSHYISRALGPAVREALEEMPVVVVTGLRQAGKSTFLRHEKGFEDRRYVTLDDFAVLDAARRDPLAFLGSDPICVDEAQKCPELLAAVKTAVDRSRRPGQFLLSGSANFSLLEGVSESLAGRAIYLTLHPFTRRELSRAGDRVPFVKALFDRGAPPALAKGPAIQDGEIVRGGLAPVALELTEKPALWFRGYEQTYLERDLRDLSRIVDLVSFRNLLALASHRTGCVLNLSDLSRDSKLKAATAGRHLGLLEASFVIRRLQPYLGNRASRLIKSPKIYIADSGLAVHLTGAGAGALREDSLYGALLETYVAQNLAGILEAHWPEARLSYWHVQGRHEVDFVIEKGRETIAIEVKSGARFNDGDLGGLEAFLSKTPRCRVAVLAYSGRETVRLGDRLWAVPHSHLIC